jgi:transposase
MAQCETCGNDYDKAFQVVINGVTHTFDSFECAIHRVAPTCPIAVSIFSVTGWKKKAPSSVAPMPKPYSEDLRERVIEAVESGASRREAAENFQLSPSSAVRWWRRWHDTGSVKAKPSGGSKSPLEAHAEWLLALVAAQPDLTLDEIVTAMRRRRIPGSRTAVWRFFERHNLTFKKSPARRRTTAARRGTRTPAMTAMSQGRPSGRVTATASTFWHSGYRRASVITIASSSRRDLIPFVI